MNVSAAIAIFATIAVAGAVVIPVVLALMGGSAKRDEPWAKEQPETRSFVIFIFVVIAAAIFGLAGPSIFPGTWWGNFMATRLGKALFLISWFLLAGMLTPVLQAIGLLPEEPNRSTYVQGSRWKKNDQADPPAPSPNKSLERTREG
jgi:hypothetical protein